MNIHNITEKKIFVISTFGHNGIDWLHSLIDNHPEVLIMPGFSFFRTVDTVKGILNVNSLGKLDNHLLENAFSHLFFNNPTYKVVRRRFISDEFEMNKFNDSFMYYLNNFRVDNIYKSLFYGIHFAFSKIKNKDISLVKAIIIQEHVPWYSTKYKEIFDPYFVFMMRDPRAALAGSWIRLKNSNVSGIINPYQFDHTLLYWKYAEIFINKIVDSDRCKIMKNEDMHNNLSYEMENLCKWFSIDFHESCLSETFLGRRWLGESVYLAVDELTEPPPIGFYNKNEIEKRWRDSISLKEIRMIECVFGSIFSKYNYSTDNNIKNIDTWTGNLYCMTINTYNYESTRPLFITFLSIPRNFLRRFLILYFPLQVRNFFKIL